MNFSIKHRLHHLLALSYGLALAKTFQEIVWLMSLSLRVQIYLLSSVEFLERVFRNDAV